VLERLTDDAVHAVEPDADGRALVGYNPVHELALRFTPEGAAITSVRSDDSWVVNLRFVSYGRADRQQATEPIEPTAHGRSVEYRRPGLTEWYVNERRGLEQGFTLTAPPPGPREADPVRLVIDVDGPTNATIDSDERTLIWRDAAGEETGRYAGLVAEDADGRPVPARVIRADSAIWLEVDDTTAAYPLTIDPLVQRSKLTSSEGDTNHIFGGSVALSADGSTALVGAQGGNGGRGAAYVFVRPAGGWATATETARLTASDAATGDFFGGSVALSADGATALVGALFDDGAHSNQGSAYVFTRPVGGWASTTETAHLTASDAATGDFFGVSVALSGNGATALVGAFQDDVGSTINQGSAYVFVRPGGGWITGTETAALTASDGDDADQFGTSVALSANGATALVGANLHDVGANSNQGSAYVFVRPGGGWITGAETARLTASDGDADDQFGSSVALSTDGATALIGAYLDTTGANVRQGSAYLFTAPTNTSTSTATVTPTPTEHATSISTATPTGTATATPTGTLTATPTVSITITPTGTVSVTPTATDTPTASTTATATTSAINTPTTTPTLVVGESQATRPQDDADKPQKQTQEQRLHESHTNRYGRDHYDTGGNVAGVEQTPDGLLITLAQGRGETLIVVYRCGTTCPTIPPGRYIAVEGEVGDDGRFEATALDLAPD
jgi:hypothetical protein